jgi:Tfp pilus assembly protein PilF
LRAKAKLTSVLEYAPKNAEVVSAWGIYWEHVGDIKESRTFHEKALHYLLIGSLGGPKFYTPWP